MKLLKTTFSIFSILSILTLVSCVEEDPHRISTTAELFAGNDVKGVSYKISSAEIDLDDLNGTLILDDCVTDNTRIYYPNGRYEENEGRTKCNIEDAPGLVGFWNIINNDRQLSVVINDIEVIWDIISIDNYGHRLSKPTSQGEVTYIMERL